MRLIDYTIVLTPDDGTWLAYAPAIDGLHAVGATPEEARAELDNVFEMIREEYEEAGNAMPRP